MRAVLTRRSARSALPALAVAALAACSQPQASGPQAPSETIDARVARILSDVPLADGHNDWPWALRTRYGPAGMRQADLFADPSGYPQPGHTTIPWLREGQVGLQLWSLYVPAGLPRDEAIAISFDQVAAWREILARYPEHFTMVTTADEAEAAFRQGRIASMLAFEGAHQVGDDIALLERAHGLGVRAMTLAHSRPTELFDSATADPRHNGIAPRGADMIRAMNRLGVLVDLSHVSPAVMHAVLDIAEAPVIFSHSSAKAVTDHPRNVPDDVLVRLRANGGIVMVTFVPAFIDQARADWQARRQAHALIAGSGPEAARRLAAWEEANPRPVSTLEQVADHIEHVARVAGIAHVGIGGDYDGIPDLPRGLETVATYPALFAELARRGWSDSDLRALAGGNFLRVLRASEAAATRLAASGPA